MFCTSLRTRQQWASVPGTLLALPQPRWQERNLETHDLALPLPRTRENERQEFFHLLLLSQSDVKPLETPMERFERLYHQTGGRNVGIIFLLNEQPQSGNGTVSFLNLQTSFLSAFEIPILPLFSISSLPNTLFSFHKQLIQTHSAAPPSYLDARMVLLPYCSTNGQLSEHARNVLSDVCHSMSELSQAATSPEGQNYLRRYLSDSNRLDAEGVIAFWETEYCVDL